MRRSLLPLLLLLQSSYSLACWKMQGQIKVNQEVLRIDQKILHDQPLTFQQGPYIINIVSPSKFEVPSQMKTTAGVQALSVDIFEKKDLKLDRVSSGKLMVHLGQTATMTQEDRQKNLALLIEVKLTRI